MALQAREQGEKPEVPTETPNAPAEPHSEKPLRQLGLDLLSFRAFVFQAVLLLIVSCGTFWEEKHQR